VGDRGGEKLAASMAESKWRRIDDFNCFFFDRRRLCSGDLILEEDSTEVDEFEELEVPFKFEEFDAKVESELEFDPCAV
jgi:hypothetical protein